jgi:hypothetical protein
MRSELVYIATLHYGRNDARDPNLDLFFFFHLTTLQVNVTRLWVTASSALLSFVFIFGNSLRGIYESVVFLFWVHPFDVGDVVVPMGGASGSTSGEASRVEGIRLLTTTLVRLSDGARGCWPNVKLAAEPVLNLSRSGPKAESFRVVVDAAAATPEFLARIRAAADAAAARSPSDFTGDVAVSLSPAAPSADGGGISPLLGGAKVAVSVWWKFAVNGASPRLGAARTAMVSAVLGACLGWKEAGEGREGEGEGEGEEGGEGGRSVVVGPSPPLFTLPPFALAAAAPPAGAALPPS